MHSHEGLTAIHTARKRSREKRKRRRESREKKKNSSPAYRGEYELDVDQVVISDLEFIDKYILSDQSENERLAHLLKVPDYISTFRQTDVKSNNPEQTRINQYVTRWYPIGREKILPLYNRLVDEINTLYQERERQRINTFLRDSVKASRFEDLLDAKQLAIYQSNPEKLRPRQREIQKHLLEQKQRLVEKRECFDPDPAASFKVKIPGIFYLLCFDIEDIIDQRLINTELGFVDVNIQVSDEIFEYPLNRRDSYEFLEKARRLGFNPNEGNGLDYPRFDNLFFRYRHLFEDPDLVPVPLDEN